MLKSILSASKSVTYSIKHKERNRTFDQIRVKNPDDDDQHVDVESTTALQTHVYSGGSQPSKQKSAFQQQPEAANIEVLSTGNKRSAS